uniref:Uncharacterized protein n=1 Tax=Leptobrachium leishanense TaxID=445787 RepID=A0A8C5MAR3_9ANUR
MSLLDSTGSDVISFYVMCRGLLTIINKALPNSAPHYQSSLVPKYIPACSLRSNSDLRLASPCITSSHDTLQDFSRAAPSSGTLSLVRSDFPLVSLPSNAPLRHSYLGKPNTRLTDTTSPWLSPCSPWLSPCSPWLSPCSPWLSPCSPWLSPCSPWLSPCSPWLSPCSPWLSPCSPAHSPCSPAHSPCSPLLLFLPQPF